MLLALQSSVGFVPETDQPFRLSDFPWWGWLICAMLILAFALVLLYAAHKKADSLGIRLIAAPFVLLGILTFIVAIVQMVKRIRTG